MGPHVMVYNELFFHQLIKIIKMKVLPVSRCVILQECPCRLHLHWALQTVAVVLVISGVVLGHYFEVEGNLPGAHRIIGIIAACLLGFQVRLSHFFHFSTHVCQVDPEALQLDQLLKRPLYADAMSTNAASAPLPQRHSMTSMESGRLLLSG